MKQLPGKVPICSFISPIRLTIKSWKVAWENSNSVWTVVPD